MPLAPLKYAIADQDNEIRHPSYWLNTTYDIALREHGDLDAHGQLDWNVWKSCWEQRFFIAFI